MHTKAIILIANSNYFIVTFRSTSIQLITSILLRIKYLEEKMFTK